MFYVFLVSKRANQPFGNNLGANLKKATDNSDDRTCLAPLFTDVNALKDLFGKHSPDASALPTLKTVCSVLHASDGPFNTEFSDFGLFERSCMNVDTQYTGLWNNRVQSYEQLASQSIDGIETVLKPLPAFSFQGLEAFVSKGKSHEKAILNQCQSASELDAAVSADAESFRCSKSSLCSRIADSRNLMISLSHAPNTCYMLLMLMRRHIL